MAPRNSVFVALLVVFAVFAIGARAAAAQEVTRPRVDFRAMTFEPAPVAYARAEKSDGKPAEEIAQKRPSILMTSLYGMTALAQALDAHSTMSAIHAGATERNPLMRTLTSHPPAFIAMKTGAAVGLIYAGHSVAKKSKKQAFIVLAAIDAVYFGIAAHNYHVAARLR